MAGDNPGMNESIIPSWFMEGMFFFALAQTGLLLLACLLIAIRTPGAAVVLGPVAYCLQDPDRRFLRTTAGNGWRLGLAEANAACPA